MIATDRSKEQLDFARQHPKVTYAVTPPDMTDEDLFSMVAEEGSVDLVTVATAVHWFDLKTFYSQVKRVLRKPSIRIFRCNEVKEPLTAFSLTS